MNRSLEALAILTICLGGILAVVRISSQDQAPARNIAKGSQSPAAPAATSGSAADSRLPTETIAWTYERGCGLDRSAGLVYPQYSPLLSPGEIARRAIRSAPLPMFVLPDPSEFAGYEQSLTHYDATYDAAVFGENPQSEELSYEQIEQEYAAAELAAAQQPVGTWLTIVDPFQTLWSRLSEQAKTAQQAYAAPAWRAIEARWSQSSLPKLLLQPRAKAQSRPRLWPRQPAQGQAVSRITWDDYLAFAERNLSRR